MPPDTTILQGEYVKFFQSGLGANILISIFILLIGFIAGNLAGKFIRAFLIEIEVNKHFRKAFDIRVNFEEMIGNLIKYLIYAVTVLMSIEKLGILSVFLNSILVAVIFIVSVTAISSVLDFMFNFIIGFFFINHKNLNPGKSIRFNEISGYINKKTLTNLSVLTEEGDLIVLPYSFLKKEAAKISRFR